MAKTIATILFLSLAIGACERPVEEPGEGPVATVRAFLRAVRRDDCEAAWTYFSRATQEKIAAESERAVREQPWYAADFSPQNLYCKSTYAQRYREYVPETAALAAADDERATVTVMLREGTDFLLPGFFPTSQKDTPVPVQLARELGIWRIDRTAGAPPSPALVVPQRPSREPPRPPLRAGQEEPGAEEPRVSIPPPSLADTSGNLLSNGTFEGLAPWTEYHTSNVPDLAEVTAVENAVVWRRRRSQRDGGLVGVYQDIDVDVSASRSLTLCVDVRVDDQALGNTGWWSEAHGGAGEMPAKVVIRYQDAAGESREWQRGFMLENEPETSIRTFDLLPTREWRHFCFDLLDDAVRRDARGQQSLPRPARIGRVHLVGSGWDFGAAMANVVLRSG